MSDEPLQDDRSLGELLSTLTSDLSVLLRDEVELAKEELRIEAQKAQTAAVSFAIAAVAGLLAGVALVMTLGYALDEALPTWAAFLVVTLVLGTVAAALGLRGRSSAAAIAPVPDQTIDTLKEDAQWLSERRS